MGITCQERVFAATFALAMSRNTVMRTYIHMPKRTHSLVQCQEMPLTKGPSLEPMPQNHWQPNLASKKRREAAPMALNLSLAKLSLRSPLKALRRMAERWCWRCCHHSYLRDFGRAMHYVSCPGHAWEPEWQPVHAQPVLECFLVSELLFWDETFFHHRCYHRFSYYDHR